MNKSAATFIHCWDTEGNKPQNLVVGKLFVSVEAARDYIARYFRNLEYRAHEQWDELKHGRRTIYPVPVKHVLFDAPKEGFKHRLVTMPRKLFPRNPVLKGV